MSTHLDAESTYIICDGDKTSLGSPSLTRFSYIEGLATIKSIEFGIATVCVCQSAMGPLCSACRKNSGRYIFAGATWHGINPQIVGHTASTIIISAAHRV